MRLPRASTATFACAAGAATDSRSGSAAERPAFLEQLADSPHTMLFLFAKDLQFQDPLQTPSILVRVMRTARLGPRPVDP